MTDFGDVHYYNYDAGEPVRALLPVAILSGVLLGCDALLLKPD